MCGKNNLDHKQLGLGLINRRVEIIKTSLSIRELESCNFLFFQTIYICFARCNRKLRLL